MVKISDVAREAGTSVATVSRALNHNDRVDPELVGRVIAAATRLGYKPNQLARNLRRQRTNLWVLIISDIENSFFTSIARGVEDVAQQNGYSIVLCNADEDEKKEERYVDLAANELAAGVILSPHSAQARIEPLITKSIPLVAIDRSLDLPVDFVTTDSRGGARAATQHLLAQGWRRPACITGPKSAETAELRRLGYEDALSAADPRASRVVHQRFHIDGGRAGAAHLLEHGTPPDSFFAANAVLALGVLEELRSRGLRPGSDVGLICFDDMPWAPFTDPPISVVSQPAYQIGARAAALLTERINGTLHGPPQRIVLDTTLVVRGSSLRPVRGASPGRSAAQQLRRYPG
jgi:LacI family transcriptional regulator